MNREPVMGLCLPPKTTEPSVVRQRTGVTAIFSICSAIVGLVMVSSVYVYRTGFTINHTVLWKAYGILMVLLFAPVVVQLRSNHFSDLLPRLNKKQWLIVTSASVALGLWSMALSYGTIYHCPLIPELFALHKTGTDAIFQAILAQNLHDYGVVSTGLDGLVPFHYHIASQWIFGYVAAFMGIPTIQFYMFAYPIIVVPLFLQMFLLVSGSFRPAPWTLSEVSSGRFWLVVSIALIGCIPPSAQVFVMDLQFASESYALSLIAAAGLSMLISTLLRKGGSYIWVASAIFAPALVLLILCKVSWLVCGSVILVFLLVRLKEMRTPSCAFGVLIALAAAYVTNKVSHVSECSGPLQISIGDMFKYIPAGHIPDFSLLYFLPVWTLLLVSALRHGRETFSLKCRETVDVQLVILLTVAGLSISNLIELVGFGAQYFLDPVRWIALLFLVQRLASAPSPTRFPRSQQVLTCISLILMIFTLSATIGDVVSFNIKQRSLVVGTGQPSALNCNKYYLFMRYLCSLRKLPWSERKETMIFVPQACATMWHKPVELDSSSSVRIDRCLPFEPSVFSGMVTLDGMPPAERTPAYYSYGLYKRRRSGFDQVTDPDALLRAARERGFKRVLIVDTLNDIPFSRLVTSPQPI